MKKYFIPKSTPAAEHKNRFTFSNPHRIIRMDEEMLADMVRSVQLKSTPPRRAIAAMLSQRAGPVSGPEISNIFCTKNNFLPKPLTESTVYRVLDDLVTSGIIARVDFQHDHAHYEYVLNRIHHHHVICTNCDDTEEITNCDRHGLETEISQQLKKFSEIKSHSLEFFGVCKKCALTSKK